MQLIINQILKSIWVTGNWMVVLWLSKCICYFVLGPHWICGKAVQVWNIYQNPTSQLQKGSTYKDPLCQNALTINTKGLKCHQSCILSKITYSGSLLINKMHLNILRYILYLSKICGQTLTGLKSPKWAKPKSMLSPRFFW